MPNFARAIVAFVLLLLALPAANGAPVLRQLPGQEGERQLLVNENVELLGLKRDDFWQVSLLVRLCAREVDELVGRSTQSPRRLVVLLMERDFGDDEFDSDEVPVRLQEGVATTVWRLCRGMLERRSGEVTGEGGRRRSRRAHSNAMLAAALTNRIVFNGQGGRGAYSRDYRIPRNAFAKGLFPQVEKLLDNPVHPRAAIIFRLYAVHCDLLLQCLERSTKSMPALLQSWWRRQSADGKGAAAALSAVLGQGNFRSGEKLQGWYQRNALEQSRRGIYHLGAQEILQQLEGLLAIAVMDASQSGGVRMVPLEEIPKLAKEYRLDTAALTQLQQRLVHLKIQSPPLFQNAIGEFVEAVDELRRENNRKFRRLMRRGREELARVTKLQRRGDELLEQVEREESTPDLTQNRAWMEVFNHLQEFQAPLDDATGVGLWREEPPPREVSP